MSAAKWTRDGKYFGDAEQVDAYDRGEPVQWGNVHSEPEVQEIKRSAPGVSEVHDG